MAPKKKHQKQNTSSKEKPTPSTGPKLQLSTENENRLRRLLINSGSSSPSPAPVEEHLSKENKARRLRLIYEKLSCEGFKDDQIELALSSLKVGVDAQCLPRTINAYFNFDAIRLEQ